MYIFVRKSEQSYTKKQPFVMTIEQIKRKMITGDYITLGRMLGITPETARMRFRRGKDDAVSGMKKIIESRDELVRSTAEALNPVSQESEVIGN